MEFQKYGKIKIVGHEDNEGIFSNPSDEIVIQEKLDGANFRFMIRDGNIIFGSRSQQLTSDEGEDTNIQKNFLRAVNFVRDKLSLDSRAGEIKKYEGYIFYGECLHGDTIIYKAGGGKGGKANYMTIKEMYDYSSTKLSDRDSTWWEKHGMPSLYSLDINSDKILPNKMINVIKTGVKDCFEIKTRLGYNIKCSNNHPVFTNNGFISISGGLGKGDCIGISDLVKKRKKRNLGTGSTKIIQSQKRYIKSIGKCEKCGSPSSLELHHRDGDFMNNETSNFQCLCRECHKKIGVDKNRKKEYNYFFDSIVSIEHIGEQEMYDIQMEAPNHNFIANNIIVHNCMVKHTMSYDWDRIPPLLGFDIYDIEKERYLKTDTAKVVFEGLGLAFVPIIKTVTAGELKEITEDIIPISKYSLHQAEGVVFKNNEKQLIAKLVREKFKEKNKEVFGGCKKHAKTDEEYLVAVYCTNSRIDKMIFKLTDEGEKIDMPMMKQLPTRVYKDIWEENWQEITNMRGKVVDFQSFKKKVTGRCLAVLKQVIVNNALSVGEAKA